MRAGQRIITHDHDYGANWVAFLRAVEVRGVKIDQIPSDPDGQIDLDRLAAALARPDEVAVVSLAWIPTSGGLVNPAAAVGELTERASVPFLLDACQAVGQIDIDVASIGCDFLAATGRKFLRGPRGTGFLYARDSVIERITPAQPDHHGAEWVALDRYEFVDGARRFEYWEFDHAAWLGLGAAVDHAIGLGIERIESTIRQRAEELRSGLREVGLRVHDQGVDRCGIVTATHPIGVGIRDCDDVLSRADQRIDDTRQFGARRHGESRDVVDGAAFGSLHDDRCRDRTNDRRPANTLNQRPCLLGCGLVRERA